jgi:hypothetical protein
MDMNEEEYDRLLHEVENSKRQYCLVCHADLTEYLHELDEIEPGEEYGLWCRECGSFVIPMDADELPY